MSNNRRAITVRMEKSVYDEYRERCMKTKRSMSRQGELLIEKFIIGGETSDISDEIWNILDEIRKQIDGQTS